MSDGFRLDLDHAAIADLATDDDAIDLAQEVGDLVAAQARSRAPKNTGAGAASIHAEVDVDGQSAYADVSWDRPHYYLGFAETGTVHQSPTPFLRPALDATSV